MMPSVSKKQHGFMAAVANNPKFAKKVGVSKSVGEEFMKSDKGRKFRAGGLKEVDSDSNPGLSKLPTEVRNKMGYMKKGGEAKVMVKKEVEFMKKKGAPKSMIKHEMAESKGMKKGGMAHSDIAKDKPMMTKVAAKAVKGHEKRMHSMAKGGGIEIKGKTKGTMIKMKSGGRAC
jgi:hypothetical protein